MNSFLPRLLYLLAAVAWMLLFSPNPITIFMAACFACLTLPVYRRLRRKSIQWQRQLKKSGLHSRGQRFQFWLAKQWPLGGYVSFLLSCLLVPVATLILLVSPQAVAGLARLRELQANNFQLPPAWVERIQIWRASLSEFPTVEKTINEFLHNLDTMFGDAVGMLVTRSFGFLGGTMTVLWTTFLFVTLTVLFTMYARPIFKISCRIFHMPKNMLQRFVTAIFRALRSIMLGVVLVALAQGFLCGIGFAVAGVNQPAFWGMLASLVAPIPMVGTALVWLPLCISLWFTGSTMAAVGLALWGMLAVAGIDNILRPLFLRQGIRAPFLVLILSILCGLASFGAVGLIVGPVLLAFSIQAVEEANLIYKKNV